MKRGSYADLRIIIIRSLVKRDGGQFCRYCKKPLNFLSEITLDHIISRSKGGEDIIDNLAICCDPCNGEKGDKIEFRAETLIGNVIPETL